MTRPLEFPPFPKETLGCACSNIARSPLVSTICTLGPPDVVCVVSLEPGQLLKKRQTVHTNARGKSPAILRSWSGMRVRISETIIASCCNILASRRRLPLAIDVADKNLMRVKSLIVTFAGKGQTLFVCQPSGEDGG